MKSKVKRFPKKSKQKKEPVKQNKFNYLIILAIILFGVGVIALLTLNFPSQHDDAEVAAMVNDEPIFASELNENYDRIPAEYKMVLSKDGLLDNMIEQKILLQKAKNEGISVSEEEIDSVLQGLLVDNGMTMEQLNLALEQQNLSMAQLRDSYYQDISIRKLLEQEVTSQIEVTVENITSYYVDHQDEFKMPESINVSHILVCYNGTLRCQNNRSAEEAQDIIAEALSALEEDNFASVASKYSDEPAASITGGNLGFISREDPFDTTFLDEAFNVDVGDVSPIIETDFGYHLITVHSKEKERVLTYSELKGQINQTLTKQYQMDAINNYIEEIKENSIIIKFNSS